MEQLVQCDEGQGCFGAISADLGDIGLSYLSRQVILPDSVSFREQSPLSSSSCRQGDKSLTSDGHSSKVAVKIVSENKARNSDYQKW